MADVSTGSSSGDSGSPEAVALKLMEWVYRKESPTGPQNGRGYWVTLYAQCLAVVKGDRDVAAVMKLGEK